MIHTLWNKEIAGIIDILSFTVQKHLDICIEVKEIITIGANKKYHAYKQYELFMGGNPLNVADFDAEVEISLGEEAETYTIDSTAMVHIKEGLVHRQVNFKRVGKPIIFVNFFLKSDD
jgi:hypothetical protein